MAPEGECDIVAAESEQVVDSSPAGFAGHYAEVDRGVSVIEVQWYPS
ncbi:hypothetical protein [Nocardia sp. CA-290969]